jgi:hypothetical protein
MRIPRPSTRTVVTSAVVAVTGTGAGAVLGAYTAVPGHETLLTTVGAVFGTVLAAGIIVYLPLARRVGRLTAVAAISASTAALFAALAALTPTCPESTTGCTTGDIGGYLLSGLLLPVSFALLMLPTAAIGRFTWRLVRKLILLTRPAPAGKSAAPTGRRGPRPVVKPVSKTRKPVKPAP